MQFLPFQPLSLEKGSMEVERPISPAGTREKRRWVIGREGGKDVIWDFPVVLLEAARNKVPTTVSSYH